MGDKVKTLVDSKIKGKKVMIFSKSFDPYSSKAKKVFARYVGDELSATEYEVMEIEDHPECDAIQDYLNSITGGRSVPRVFINGSYIGGADDVVALHDSGQLRVLLAMS